MIALTSIMIGGGVFAVLILLIIAALFTIERPEDGFEAAGLSLMLCSIPMAWIIAWAVVRSLAA